MFWKNLLTWALGLAGMAALGFVLHRGGYYDGAGWCALFFGLMCFSLFDVEWKPTSSDTHVPVITGDADEDPRP